MRKTYKLSVDERFRRSLARIRALTGVTYRRQTRLLASGLERLPEKDVKALFPRKRHRRRWGRRGQLETSLFPFWMFFIAVIAVVVVVVALQLSSDVSTGKLGESWSAETRDTVGGGLGRLPRLLDFVVVGIAAMFLMASAWVSAQIPTKPIFAAILVPILLLGVFFSLHLSNSWDLVTDDGGALSTAVANLPGTNFLFEHLVGYTVLVIVVSGIVFYGASRGGFGAGGAFG